MYMYVDVHALTAPSLVGEVDVKHVISRTVALMPSTPTLLYAIFSMSHLLIEEEALLIVRLSFSLP